MPDEISSLLKTDKTFLDRVATILLCSVVVSLGLVQTRIPVGPLELGLTEVLFLLLLPFWVVSVGNYRPTLRQKWIWISLAVYLAAGILSAFFSASPRTSLKHMIAEIYLALLFVVSTTLINDVGKVKTIIFAWLIGTLIASLLALVTIAIFYIDPQNTLLEFLTYHYGSVPVGNFPRVTATFASASLFFNYLSVSIVMLLCCWKFGWISRRLYLVSIVVTSILAVFTFSVGLGSFFLIAAWWVYLSNSVPTKEKRWIERLLVFVSIVWLVMAVVALQPYPESPFTIGLSGTDFKIYPSARYLVWTDTFRTIEGHLLWGVGPGNPVCKVIFTNTDGSVSLLTDAHNTFLNVLAERGVAGFLAIITAIGLIIRPSAVLESADTRLSSDFISKCLRFALVTGFVYQGLVGSFEDAKHLWVLMGITVAVGKLSARDNSPIR